MLKKSRLSVDAYKCIALDYRLAPESPFPAAVHDALAAYLYLIEPPADAGFAPINPKNIVIMGDSAGGGTFSLFYSSNS